VRDGALVTSFGKNAVVKGAEERRSRGRRTQFALTLGVFPYIGFFRTTTLYMGVDTHALPFNLSPLGMGKWS